MGSQTADGSVESARRRQRGDEKRGCGSLAGSIKTEGGGNVGDGGTSTRTAVGNLGRELEVCFAREGGCKSAERKRSSKQVAAGKGQAAARRRRRGSLTATAAGAVGCKREEDERGRQRVNEAGGRAARARDGLAAGRLRPSCNRGLLAGCAVFADAQVTQPRAGCVEAAQARCGVRLGWSGGR